MGYNGLTNQHIEALNLLKEGKYTHKEIASRLSIHPDTLRGWINGDQNAGATAALFSAEYNKIKRDLDSEICAAMRAIQNTLAGKLQAWAEAVQPATLQEVKVMRGVLATVAEAQKQDVDITQIFNYSSNVEDIVSEAKRLQTIADAALNRSANPRPGSRGQGQVLGASEEGDQAGEEAQEPNLPAEPEAGDVPSKPRPGKGGVRRKPKR